MGKNLYKSLLIVEDDPGTKNAFLKEAEVTGKFEMITAVDCFKDFQRYVLDYGTPDALITDLFIPYSHNEENEERVKERIIGRVIEMMETPGFFVKDKSFAYHDLAFMAHRSVNDPRLQKTHAGVFFWAMHEAQGNFEEALQMAKKHDVVEGRDIENDERFFSRGTGPYGLDVLETLLKDDPFLPHVLATSGNQHTFYCSAFVGFLPYKAKLEGKPAPFDFLYGDPRVMFHKSEWDAKEVAASILFQLENKPPYLFYKW